MLAITRTKNSIRRLRLEYSILLERLEQNALNLPENLEEMSPPPSPSLDINDEKTLKGPAIKKHKRSKVEGASGTATAKSRIRDPNLPKRPTNAYLIFCELEKERMKQSTGDNSLASITELGKSLVEAWKNLDEEARKPYHKIFEEDKERYKQEMMAYNKKNRSNVSIDGDEADMDLEQIPDEYPDLETNDMEVDTEQEPMEDTRDNKEGDLVTNSEEPADKVDGALSLEKKIEDNVSNGTDKESQEYNSTASEQVVKQEDNNLITPTEDVTIGDATQPH